MKPGIELKKVVLFTGLLGRIGGAERLLWEEEKFFRKKGAETLVLAFRALGNLYDYEPERVELIGERAFKLLNAVALVRKLRQIKPDLIVAQTNLDAMYLYLATMLAPIPYIVHLHGTLFWFNEETLKYAFIHRRVFQEIRNSLAGHKEFVPVKPHCSLKEQIASEFLAVLDYLAVRKARRIITLTDQLKWEITKLYGRDSTVARGCLPPEALNYRPGQDVRRKLGLESERIILSIGRLDPRKRIDLLLKAFAKISIQYDDVYLVIGGVGEEADRLKTLAQELGVAERVKFLGLIPDSELFDYYAACNVFAFPSWTSSGITPYEALAVGKKVVWTTEADEPVLPDSHVFLAEFNPEFFPYRPYRIFHPSE